MGINVWAEAMDVPGRVCHDARLRAGKETSVTYPHGKKFGQAGWDMGIQFKSLDDLADKLYRNPVKRPSNGQPIQKGEITRLAIHVHGVSGKIFPEGRAKANRALTHKNVESFHTTLHQIGLSTTQSATILIVGCLAGGGEDGTLFLQKLSKIWLHRKVVGFTTLGFVSAADQKRSPLACNEPGMRDTGDTSPDLDRVWERQRERYGPIWNDLSKLPWASEHSPHAKVAENGIIKRRPKSDPALPVRKRISPKDDAEVMKLWRETRKWYNVDMRKYSQAQSELLILLRRREAEGKYYDFRLVK